MIQPYIVQGPTFGCLVVALCNFLRWAGKETPEPGTEEWEDLIDFAGSRCGPAKRYHEAAELLGIKLLLVPYEYAIENTPSIVSVENPLPGTFLHAVFVAPGPIAINHWWLKGPVESPIEEMVPWTRFGNWTVELVAEPRKAPRCLRPPPRRRVSSVPIDLPEIPMGQFLGLTPGKRWLH